MNAHAIHINAGNDRNGNPRRGWLVYESDGRRFVIDGVQCGPFELLAFVDEGHLGENALAEWADANGVSVPCTLCRLSVPVAEYKAAKGQDTPL